MNVYIHVCILISSSNAATAICIAMYYLYIVYSCIYDCMCTLTFASIAPVCHPTCSAKKSATFVKLGISSLQVAHELKCWKLYRKGPLVGFPGQLIRGRPEEQNKWSETSAFKYPTAGNCGGPKLGNVWVFCVQVPLKMLKYWGWKPPLTSGLQSTSQFL